MKKKFREITVERKKYGWTVKNNCDSDGSNQLTVWINKKPVFSTFVPGSEIITPSVVESYIKIWTITE
jgi:hypothetical protein